MASLVLGLAGAAVGSTFGYASLGYTIGSFLGNAIFGQERDREVTQVGPRLEQRNAQISSFGASVPEVYGTMRLAGNIIWIRNNQIDETEVRTTTTTRSGGKGAFFGGSETRSTIITYRYTVRFAVLLCRGPVVAISRIWWNGNLVWDRRNGNIAGSLPITIYLGTDDQDPDPTMEEALGAGEVPGYRGYCYVVFKDHELEKGGNTIGNWEFEVVRNGTVGYPDPEYLQPDDYSGNLYSNPQFRSMAGGVRDEQTGLWWFIGHDKVLVVDPVQWETVAVLDVPPGWDTTGNTSDNMMAYQPPLMRVNPLSMSPEFLPARIWAIDQSLNPDNVGSLVGVWDAQSFELVAYFHLDAETIGLSETLDTFMGTLICDPVAQRMYTWDSQFADANGLGIDCWLFGLNQLQTNTTGSTHDVVRADDWGYIVRITEEGYILVTEIGDASQIILVESQNPWWTLALFPRIAYDPTRGRVWPMGDITGSGLGYFDLTTFTWHTVISLASSRWAPCLYIPELDAVACEDNTVGGSFPDSNLGDIILVHASGDGSYEVLPFAAADNLIGQSSNSSFPTLGDKLFYPPEGGGAYMFAMAQFGLVKVYLTDAVTDGSTTLRVIVEDICDMVGLHPKEVDASALTETIRGYLIPRQMTARAAIEQLQTYGLFSGAEADTKIKFPLRDGVVSRALVERDLVIDDDGRLDTEPEVLKITRTEEPELPREFAVTHINPDHAYLQTTHRARRLITRAENHVTVELAISMVDSVAKQKVEKLLDTSWAEREQFTFSVSQEDADLLPVDIVSLTMDDNTAYELIIDRVDYAPSNRVQILARSREGATYASTTTASVPGAPPPDTVAQASPTKLILADIPLLVDSHNGAGHYIWVAPFHEDRSWPAAAIYRAPNFSDFVQVAGMSTPVDYGYVLNSSLALRDWKIHGIDREGSLTVHMGRGTLSSIDETLLYTGRNAFLWGDEIIQAATVSAGAVANEYILTNIVRGRRGTEVKARHTQTSEIFVVLEHATVTRLPTDASEAGVPYNYKAVTQGTSFINAPYQPFINTEAGLRPLAPTQSTGTWDTPSSNDITLAWKARTRVGGMRLPNGIAVPISEASEAYDVELLNESGTVVRSANGLTSKQLVYTSAQQTTDFGADVNWIHARIYQKSASVGRGFTQEHYLIRSGSDRWQESFGSMSTGATPTGWTSVWNTPTSWDVTADVTAIGGKFVAARATSDNSYAIIAPNSDRHPIREALFRFRMPALSGSATNLQGFRLFISGNGVHTPAPGTRDAAFFGVKPNGTSWGFGLLKDAQAAAGIANTEIITRSFTFLAGQWYWGRVRIQDQWMYGKVWRDDAGVIEPYDWQLQAQNFNFPRRGWVGFGFSEADNDADLDFISVAYGGPHA